MAKAWIKKIVDKVKGPLGHIDRTIGREGGFSVSVGGRTGDDSIRLGSKKQGTRGGSPARHARAQVYCNCDDNYRAMAPGKKGRLVFWYRKILDKAYLKIDAYHIWMKICLGARLEASAFYCHCYIQRYKVVNDSPLAWRDQPVDLEGIVSTGPTDDSFRLFYLFSSKTTRDGIVYENGMIDKELTFDLIEEGVIRFTSPFCAAYSYYYVDVYSMRIF